MEHSVVLRDSLNVNMKLFPMGLVPITQTLRPWGFPFDFLFAKKSMLILSSGYTTISKSTVNICERGLLEVTALKCSAKGAVNSSFPNAPYTKPSTNKSTTEMQFVMDLP